jgi:2,3-dihydroxybenzoate decarboxylase
MPALPTTSSPTSSTSTRSGSRAWPPSRCRTRQRAAAELRRAIEVGLCGALVNDHTLGHYLDEPQYAPFWETLQDLEVPLYIHPNAVSSDSWKVIKGHPALDTAMWGWAPRTGGHAMRLILGGVFDRYPNAQVILGHMGEFLPFQLTRLDSRFEVLDFKHPLKKLPSEYFRTNSRSPPPACSPTRR